MASFTHLPFTGKTGKPFRGKLVTAEEAARINSRRSAPAPYEAQPTYLGSGGVKGAVKQLSNGQRLENLGIPRSLMPPDATLWCNPSQEELTFAASFRESSIARVKGAHAPSYDKRLGTVIGCLEQFATLQPSRILFVRLQFEGDLRGMAHNDRTLSDLIEHIRQTRQILSDSIADYISNLSTELNLQACSRIAAPSLWRRNMLLQMRANDGAKGSRKLERGLRAAQLRLLAESPEWDRSSLYGRFRWMVLLLCHNLICRGGQLGVQNQGDPFNTTRGFTWFCVEWKTPEESRSVFAAFNAWLVGIKDANKTKSWEAVPVRRRMTGIPRAQELGVDPMCVYDAVNWWWQLRRHTVKTEAQMKSEPVMFFPFGRKGIFRNMCTKDVCDMVREAVRFLGVEDPDEYGAKSPRIGGATDLADHPEFTLEEAKLIINERGLWDSDIATIYKRMSANRHLRASYEIGNANTVDLEAFASGWKQSTRRAIF